MVLSQMSEQLISESYSQFIPSIAILKMAPCNADTRPSSSCHCLAFLSICNFTLNIDQAIFCLGDTFYAKHITKSQRMKKKEEECW